MRIIKFRAWDGKYLWSWEKIKEWGNIFDQEELIKMQFTCLKNKEGKEIYEGDILNCQWNIDNGIPGDVITYIIDNGSTVGCFALVDKNGDYRPLDINNIKFTYIIQGNIYENPELLK